MTARSSAMHNTRPLKDVKMASCPFPVWKVKPPGPEQKELQRLFLAKKIDATDTAENVRKDHEMFQKFNPTVFATNFRKTRAKFGCATTVGVEAGPSNIPELGSLNAFFAPDQSLEARESPQSFIDRPPIEFKNSPFWTWVYTDHVKKMDFVCVAVLTMCGSEENKFKISEDGMQITMKYKWSSAMYKAAELFENAKDGNNQKLPIYHPKIHAFMSHLLESGVTDNSSPEAEMIIDLPIKVQRTTTSWKKEAVKSNDANIILLEFSAYQKELLISEADTIVQF